MVLRSEGRIEKRVPPAPSARGGARQGSFGGEIEQLERQKWEVRCRSARFTSGGLRKSEPVLLFCSTRRKFLARLSGGLRSFEIFRVLFATPPWWVATGGSAEQHPCETLPVIGRHGHDTARAMLKRARTDAWPLEIRWTLCDSRSSFRLAVEPVSWAPRTWSRS